MNAHDWTRVDAGTFHGFHGSWIAFLKRSIRLMLPAGFYVDSDQRLEDRKEVDVLTLHESGPADRWPPAVEDWRGALAVAEHPPAAAETRPLVPVARGPRSLAIRHARGHRLVALVEIVSPGNKNSSRGIEEFTRKACQAIRAGVHVAVIDVLPPTALAPDGLLGAVEEGLTGASEGLPSDRPLAFVSYRADSPPVAYIQRFAVGWPIPGLPLFLTSDHFLELPLARSYETAFEDVPPFAQRLLTGEATAPA